MSIVLVNGLGEVTREVLSNRRLHTQLVRGIAYRFQRDFQLSARIVPFCLLAIAIEGLLSVEAARCSHIIHHFHVKGPKGSYHGEVRF